MIEAVCFLILTVAAVIVVGGALTLSDTCRKSKKQPKREPTMKELIAAHGEPVSRIYGAVYGSDRAQHRMRVRV